MMNSLKEKARALHSHRDVSVIVQSNKTRDFVYAIFIFCSYFLM